MSIYKHHLDLANDRFNIAERLFEEEDYHTAAHLYVNAAINYHNAICQKYLNKIPSHKQHSDTSYFKDLTKDLDDDYQRYEDAYKYLMAHKSEADYGTELSLNTTKQIMRRAKTIKEIAEHLI